MRYFILITLLLAAVVQAHDRETEATYLGNAGVLVSHGDIQIAFDPLFDEDFDTYDLVPDDVKRQLIDGDLPFDSLDAIFISHVHDDHFDASLIAKALMRRPALQLFAPKQAIDAVLKTDVAESVADRMHAVDLILGEQAFQQSEEGYDVEAIRVPHGGWPDRHATVENIAFRVTLSGNRPVLHLGDATRKQKFYADTDAFWKARRSVLALPPYWFFLNDAGRAVLERYIDSATVIGIHVPAAIPSDPAEREEALQHVVLFTDPGETISLL